MFTDSKLSLFLKKLFFEKNMPSKFEALLSSLIDKL